MHKYYNGTKLRGNGANTIAALLDEYQIAG